MHPYRVNCPPVEELPRNTRKRKSPWSIVDDFFFYGIGHYILAVVGWVVWAALKAFVGGFILWRFLPSIFFMGMPLSFNSYVAISFTFTTLVPYLFGKNK